jgi:pimeloyl-ACP methyl ester carboxylesterase
MIPDDVLRRRVTLPATGNEIALQDWGGDGPLALLHHANGFCAALWAPVAEQLRDRYHVVAMDARGAGDSPLPPVGEGENPCAWDAMGEDLVAVAELLLAEAGHERLGLGLGHSFGGTLTLLAEASRPGLFERIVAVDPVTPPPPEMLAVLPASKGFELAERAKRRRSVWPDRATARAHFADRELFRSWTSQALDLYVAEGLRTRADGQVELKCSPAVEAAVFGGSGTLDVFAAVKGLQLPVLLLWARRGNFPRQAFERLAAGMADARIEDVDAGHLIPMEVPDLVVAAIRRFSASDRRPARRPGERGEGH